MGPIAGPVKSTHSPFKTMRDQYGYVDPRFDQVARDNVLRVSLAALPLYGESMAVASDPLLALLTPIVGLDAGEEESPLTRAGESLNRLGDIISAVYTHSHEDLTHGGANGAVELAAHEWTHTITIEARLLSEALRLFENEQITLSLSRSQYAGEPTPWRAIALYGSGGNENIAIIPPIEGHDGTTGKCNDRQPLPAFPLQLPEPFAPFNPSELEDDETYYVAVRGTDKWIVTVADWGDDGDFYITGAIDRPLFPFLNPSEIPSLYFCQWGLLSAKDLDDLLTGIPYRLA